MSKNIPLASADFQIVIPTHNRPTSQITLMEFPEDMRKNVLVITSTQKDADIIRKKYKHKRVFAIENPKVNSIAKKRHWIMKYVESTKIMMLDDDMYFFRRCPTKYRTIEDGKSGGQWRIKPEYKHLKCAKFLNREFLTPSHIRYAFDHLERLMEKFAHVCISSRMGNDKVREEVKYVGRAMHAIGFRRDIYLEEGLSFAQIPMREDFNITLHLLRRGYPNAIIQYFTVGPKPYGSAGGCSEERTVETSNSDADVLAKEHYPFVKVTEKSYKGVNSVPRKETIIFWQKAYQSFFKS